MFVGYLGANPATPFKVDIYDKSSGDWIAYNEGEQALRDHYWLQMPLTTRPGQKFIRGRQYLVKFTRPGDSIHYYYNPNNPYGYGMLIDPNLNPVPLGWDLACRIYGVMKPVPDSFWGAKAGTWWWCSDTAQIWVERAQEAGLKRLSVSILMTACWVRLITGSTSLLAGA
ncbi:MAG: hypothetical protein ABIK44_01775 [candidate division WOR-3 bacterium]